MIATTTASYVVAIVFSTGRVMALSDPYVTKQECERSVVYTVMTEKSKKSEYKRPIICTDKPDLTL
jgi:hypothetical protein